MEALKHLKRLGDEAIKMESLYLELKIKKALAGDGFSGEHLLTEAESLWKDIREEYYGFLDYLQSETGLAA